jgi:hypothetical protein
MNIKPHYSDLPQDDMDKLTALVERVGWGAVLGGLADIVTQHPKFGRDANLSLTLGLALAKGRDVDRNCPPAG